MNGLSSEGGSQLFDVFWVRAAASTRDLHRPVDGMLTINLGIFRICVHPAHFVVCITDIPVGYEGKVLPADSLQFSEWLGEVRRWSAVDPDGGDSQRQHRIRCGCNGFA